MRYWVLTVLGLAVFLGSVLLFGVALIHMIHVGTCASGGPYVVARPCPAGTGWWISALTLSIFIGLGGLLVFALRGDRPGGGEGGLGWIGLGTLAWSIFFTFSGLCALWAVWGPGAPEEQPAGVKLGIGIMAAVFLPMGLIPLAAALTWRRSERREKGAATPAAATAPGVVSSLYQSANALGARGGQAKARAGPRTMGKEQQDEVRLTGLPGHATIKDFKYLSKSMDGLTLVSLDLEVDVEGHDPYALQREEFVPLDAVDRLKKNGSVPVRVDRDDPAALLIRWHGE